MFKIGHLVMASVYLLATHQSSAESLGTYGHTYQIKERDAIGVMKEAVRKKLANGGQEAMIKGAQERYLASLNNVVTPPGITSARSNATRIVDLTETVKKTITDGNGRIVVAEGTKINPLAIIPLTKKLFFIDAKDARQLQLVKTMAEPQDKIILLGGSVFKASEFLQRHVYLDIPGLAFRMKVKYLPSIVSQDGDMLKIQEISK